MDKLESAKVFIAIVERGSLVAAAEHLDMSRSKVTRYLNEIESWASARLLHRTTRKLSLTDAGEQVLAHCRNLVTIAEDISLSGQSPPDEITGTLRISCSHYGAFHVVWPVLPLYREKYPQVAVELKINNSKVDLIEERIDLAVRISTQLDPNLIARPLGICESVLCATPAYLKKHDTPVSLEALRHHECLIYSCFDRNTTWRFIKDGETFNQPVTGQFVADDSDILIEAALKDMGISYLPKADIQHYLDCGELVEILPQYTPVEMGVYAIYHSRKQMPLAVRLFLDMLSDQHDQGGCKKNNTAGGRRFTRHGPQYR